MKKIIFITGSYPPDPCGVGDYTYRLVSELKKDKEIEVEIFKLGNFSFKELLSIIKYLRANKKNIKIMQYPTLGYGWSVLPQILSICFYKNMYINLHEFSQRKLKAKLATLLFFYSKSYIIFTTEDEYQEGIRYKQSLKNNSFIVRIGSNIDFLNNVKKINDLIYFGIIMPDKGIEDFIEVVKEIRKTNKNDKILLIGRKQQQNRVYFEKIFNQCKQYDIELLVDYSDKKVAEILAASKVSFLPFPDGVTFRRGSLLACLGNKVNVISYINKSTNDYKLIEKICYLIENKKEFIELYNKLKKDDQNMIFETESYQTFIKSIEWKEIANKIKSIIMKEQGS